MADFKTFYTLYDDLTALVSECRNLSERYKESVVKGSFFEADAVRAILRGRIMDCSSILDELFVLYESRNGTFNVCTQLKMNLFTESLQNELDFRKR